MTTSNEMPNVQDDYYLAQNRALIEQFLADHGHNRKTLLELPEEEAHALFHLALEYAAHQIARMDAMIRLGSTSPDMQMDENVHRKHHDRLEHWFLRKSNK